MKQYKNRYTVGITGHRDLLESETGIYKEQIKTYLNQLQQKVDKALLLVSPLADGADRLFIEAGKELNIDYISVLPMPIHMYADDFSLTSLEEFNTLLIGAREYEVCDFANDNNEENCKNYGENRDNQYLEVGHQIASCDDMVTLWDGIDNGKIGGTADIISYRKSLGKRYKYIPCKRKN